MPQQTKLSEFKLEVTEKSKLRELSLRTIFGLSGVSLYRTNVRRVPMYLSPKMIGKRILSVIINVELFLSVSFSSHINLMGLEFTILVIINNMVLCLVPGMGQN